MGDKKEGRQSGPIEKEWKKCLESNLTRRCGLKGTDGGRRRTRAQSGNKGSEEKREEVRSLSYQEAGAIDKGSLTKERA